MQTRHEPSSRGHLLIATVEDANSPLAWSGTPYHLVNSLRHEFDQVTLLMTRQTVKRPWNVVPRLLFGHDRWPLWMTGPSLRLCARRLRAAVAEKRPDVVLCISSQHLVHAGELGCPTYMVSDAPWMAYKQAYAAFEPVPLLASRYAAMEALAAQRLDGCIFPTPWACAEAQQRYGVPAQRVHCVPFGANRASTLAVDVLSARIERKPSRPLNLLFVGKDWERKGGPLALQALATLNAAGQHTVLSIVGCSPEVPESLRKHVQVLGFLSPSLEADRQRLEQAYLDADVFLLPSRAECYGLVFAEAQSWGLPCVALAVQGVPGVVVDGVTGRLCPADADAADLAAAVASLVATPETYRRVALSALSHSHALTTWTAFAARVRSVVTQTGGRAV